MADYPEIQKVYCDSVFPMEVAKDGPMADRARGLFYRIRNGPYEAVIPQVVVGETHTVLIRDYPDHGIRMEKVLKLHGAFRDLGVDAHSGMAQINPWNIRAVLDDLMDLLPGMDGTDLVILAIVLADPDSALLLTTDRALLNNAKIREYEAGMRRDGLRNVRLRIKDRL